MHARARVAAARLAAEQVLELLLEVELPDPSPGQFVMLWVPRVGEVPMSVADYEGGVLRLFITRRGVVTGYIHENARPGLALFVRGPYGRGFTMPRGGRVLLVGGGTGTAPLYFLAKRAGLSSAGCTAAVGFKSSRHVILVDELRKYCDVRVATDDGSLGHHGPVHELAAALLSGERYDRVYACGPEQMIVEVLRLLEGREEALEASLERYMRCAVGVCGSCVLDPLGLRVCRDGPVFSGAVLRRLHDLGRWWREPDGRKRPLAPQATG
ncbi:MAG: dihydroorotate dehydrogenase electron transfer subunit [Thermofilum sp.]|jgi:dihydroorotate dehydrogenase electron transfer subunit|nr:dihydroorotate dehydrogenase electron transfer subunit [Thermofilum sp.]MCC6059380.1 dihydroorotate dehydrogenase electron transfer subunit [Thermofilum sp.]